MKLSAPILLSCCLLLAVTGSCKKDPVEEPAPNLANCRIVREVYKADSPQETGQQYDTITIGQKTYKLYKHHEQLYTYDESGRIVKEENVPVSKKGYSTTYTYSPGRIQVHEFASDKQYDQQYTYILNASGLAYTKVGIESDTTLYNDQGRVVESRNRGITLATFTYENDNLVRVTSKDGFVFDNQYDLTKSALPVIHPFLGKESKNLQTKSVMNSSNLEFGIGVLQQTDYTYSYDKYGRVIRKVWNQQHVSGGWYLYFLGSPVAAVNYEYECP